MFLVKICNAIIVAGLYNLVTVDTNVGNKTISYMTDNNIIYLADPIGEICLNKLPSDQVCYAKSYIPFFNIAQCITYPILCRGELTN
jgi:hypothetical protein